LETISASSHPLSAISFRIPQAFSWDMPCL
jgi:hypothetical protein